MDTLALSSELKAILDSSEVPEGFQALLAANEALAPLEFAMTCSKEELLESHLIEPSQVANLTFGEKLAIKVA